MSDSEATSQVELAEFKSEMMTDMRAMSLLQQEDLGNLFQCQEENFEAILKTKNMAILMAISDTVGTQIEDKVSNGLKDKKRGDAGHPAVLTNELESSYPPPPPNEVDVDHPSPPIHEHDAGRQSLSLNCAPSCDNECETSRDLSRKLPPLVNKAAYNTSCNFEKVAATFNNPPPPLLSTNRNPPHGLLQSNPARIPNPPRHPLHPHTDERFIIRNPTSICVAQPYHRVLAVGHGVFCIKNSGSSSSSNKCHYDSTIGYQPSAPSRRAKHHRSGSVVGELFSGIVVQSREVEHSRVPSSDEGYSSNWRGGAGHLGKWKGQREDEGQDEEDFVSIEPCKAAGGEEKMDFLIYDEEGECKEFEGGREEGLEYDEDQYAQIIDAPPPKNISHQPIKAQANASWDLYFESSNGKAYAGTPVREAYPLTPATNKESAPAVQGKIWTAAKVVALMD
ncbi:MAG: hypothetical protein MMC33_005362 [Icmadophila ericetorum]|nr:hypothetical protein [Icmadophila ericetorum]